MTVKHCCDLNGGSWKIIEAKDDETICHDKDGFVLIADDPYHFTYINYCPWCGTRVEREGEESS